MKENMSLKEILAVIDDRLETMRCMDKYNKENTKYRYFTNEEYHILECLKVNFKQKFDT